MCHCAIWYIALEEYEKDRDRVRVKEREGVKNESLRGMNAREASERTMLLTHGGYK